MTQERESLSSSRPSVGDTRIKVQRTDRFKWHAVAERWEKNFERPDSWTAITDYGKGWKRGPFRWLVVARARRELRLTLADESRERERRERYSSTEYLDA